MATTAARPPIGTLSAPKPPAVLEAELAGGLHGIFVRHTLLPLVELRLVVPLAAAQITKPAPGTVLSRSLFAGTEHHDRIGLAEAIEGLGGRLEAGVEQDRLVVSGSALSQHLGPLLGLLAEVLTGATYPQPEVRADRNRAADETVIALTQPEVIASQALRRRLFRGHPYETTMPSPAALRRVDAAELSSLHPDLFDQGAAHLVLVGDIQPARARSLAEDALGGWLARRAPGGSELAPLSAPRRGPLELVARPGSVQSNLRLGGRTPSLAEPGWPAMSLAQGIFGGMFSSRMVANLRERNGYAYTPYSLVRHARAGSSIVIAAEVATAATGAALVETLYELGRIATTGVTEDELELARHYAIGRFSFETATLPGLASTLATLAVNGVGLGYLAGYPKGVLAATKRDVDEAARHYLAPRNLVTVVVGDPAAVAEQLLLVDEVVVRRQ